MGNKNAYTKPEKKNVTSQPGGEYDKDHFPEDPIPPAIKGTEGKERNKNITKHREELEHNIIGNKDVENASFRKGGNAIMDFVEDHGE